MNIDRLERERELQLDIQHNESLEDTDHEAIEDGEKQRNLDQCAGYLSRNCWLPLDQVSACIGILGEYWSAEQSIFEYSDDGGTMFMGDYIICTNEFDQWIVENHIKEAAKSMYGSVFDSVFTTDRLIKQGAL
ncbi:MAG: hypothetical protein JKY86_15510 [Gammaproteobacteria bacterium]|nr:hypothetical protein [Gammaproteobacteria bacterium]